jgi:two-component system response regulator NreC
VAKIGVLLAEDHQTIREGLKLIIDAQPDMMVIGQAATGAEAIEMVPHLRPAVVVMDVSMPVMNGLTATERLAAADPRIRILTLTRLGDHLSVQQLLRAGAWGYVLKQSHPSELLNGIRALAAGKKYLDPAVTSPFIRQTVGAPPGAASTESLTAREEEILRLVAWGYSNKEMAARLDLSVKTIETHKANAAAKLGLRSRIDIVRLALVKGWLQDT